MFLVLNNRVVSMATAAIALAWKRTGIRPVAPLPAYAAVSLSNVIATTCQYEALRYVSFPVQTLGKCGKMIPVMLWGRLMLGRRYGATEYMVAAAVTLGATVFLMGGEVGAPSKHGKKAAPGTSVYGALLMIGYLGCDGFTSTLQDRLFKGYSMETFNQMLWVTTCSALLSAAWLLGDDSMSAAMAFVRRHPECLRAIWTLSAASAVGQLFILHTIREFGSLVFATVMTSRQFLSILLSCLIFMHPLTVAQWAGTVTIFAALYAQSTMKSSAKSDKAAGPGEPSLLPLTTKGLEPGEKCTDPAVNLP